MEEPESVDARSEVGLAVLEHAFSNGGKVLEFERTDAGEMRVADVTDHHRELQRFWDQEHEQEQENADGN